MPTTPTFDNLNGQPVFDVFYQALNEGRDGNGVGAQGDLKVTDGTNANESDIAPGTAFYNGSSATLGSTATKTHSDGDADFPRWDLLAFDVGTGSVVLREGTPTDPASDIVEPPDLQSDEVLLAVVYVEATQTDFGAGDIVNFRVPGGSQISAADDGTTAVSRLVEIDGTDGIAISDGGGGTATVTADLGTVLTFASGQITIASGGVGTTELATDAVTSSELASNGVGTDALDRNPVADDTLEGREGGTVPNGDQGLVVVDSLQDTESVEVYKATLVLDTIEAAPSGLDLELVTFDNAGGYTSQATLISGDGSTIHDRVSGDPLGSYTNSSGGEQSIGVIVDNQTGSDQEIFALAEGVAPA